jgi:Rod binding domain-containing protein
MASLDSSQALTATATMAVSQSRANNASQSLASSVDPVAAKKAAQNFEAVFLSQMFGQMFKGIGTDGLFGGGSGEEMFRPLLLDEYGKMIAKRGGVGIADAVLRSLIAQQEKTS